MWEHCSLTNQPQLNAMAMIVLALIDGSDINSVIITHFNSLPLS